MLRHLAWKAGARGWVRPRGPDGRGMRSLMRSRPSPWRPIDGWVLWRRHALLRSPRRHSGAGGRSKGRLTGTPSERDARGRRAISGPVPSPSAKWVVARWVAAQAFAWARCCGGTRRPAHTSISSAFPSRAGAFPPAPLPAVYAPSAPVRPKGSAESSAPAAAPCAARRRARTPATAAAPRHAAAPAGRPRRRRRRSTPPHAPQRGGTASSPSRTSPCNPPTTSSRSTRDP